MNLPVSDFAGGVSGNATFTLTVTPNTVQHPQGTTNTYQQNLLATSVNGFSGTVTFTIQNNLCSGGTAATLVNSVSVSPTSAGITVLNETVPTSCPIGNYTVTVTGVSGSITQTATLTVQVVGCANPPCGPGGGTKKCTNDSDCGPGNICCAGNCYSRGPCTADSDCTSTYGACSKCVSTNDPKPACLFQHCTICQGAPTGISVICPAEIDGIVNAAQTVYSTTMSVTNLSSSSSQSVTVGGQFLNFIPCIGPVTISPGSFTLAPSGSQTVTLTAYIACATAQCLNYQLKVTAGSQVVSCALQICAVACTASGPTATSWVYQGGTSKINFVIQQCDNNLCTSNCVTVVSSSTTGAGQGVPASFPVIAGKFYGITGTSQGGASTFYWLESNACGGCTANPSCSPGCSSASAFAIPRPLNYSRAGGLCPCDLGGCNCP